MTITRDVCHWTEDGDYSYWETKCGHNFEVIDGTPSENGFKYCCFCGRPLVEVPNEPDESDE